jgi:D-alanine-D-alanine ligase
MTPSKHMNKNIGVFFGSGSTEHDISIITAQLIIAGLKGLNYQVTPVYITKAGKWMLGEELGNLKMFTDPTLTSAFAKASADKPSSAEKKWGEWFLDMEKSNGKMVFKKKGFGGKSITIDLAFPAFHGAFGEDGTIQGMFEMLGIPYVGCGVPASAVAMDKALTKIVMKDAGVPTTKFIYFYKADWESDKLKVTSDIQNNLKFPVFVKPVHLGSSIGIGKVKAGDIKDLENKIEVALHYDDKVLVEEGVENLMDVTCCIIGNNELRASLLQESVFNNDLFNFEDKYISDGGAQTGKATNSLIIPARLDEATTLAIQNTAKQVYQALGCSGIARVDFLYNKQTKEFFANEVNPLPGTLYHHLWIASGLELNQLLELLIKFAEEKRAQRQEINFTFESSVLTNLGKGKLGGSKVKS